MGWVVIGALIASITYILYMHPPASWSPWNFFSRQRPDANAARIDAPQEDDSPRAKVDETDISLSNTAARDEGSLDPETTPKAKPTMPAFDIPPITLEAPINTSERAGKATSLPKNISDASIEDENTSNISAPPPPRLTVEPPAPVISQEQRGANPPAAKSAAMMMPPPPPSFLRPPPSLRTPIHTPPSAAASLRVPPGSRPSTSTLPVLSLPGKPQRSSRPVVLEPGHSPLDWAALTSNPRNNLRGAGLPPTLVRVTPSMLKEHNGRKGRDAWTSYQGKVYNITPFAPFHPGGKGELLRGAGKDSERLFAEIHPWVNWDGMLAECMVGILVAEHSVGDRYQDGKLDDMD